MLAPPKQPQVLLAEHEEGYGFCVSVLPPPLGVGHDQCFPEYIQARTYARHLRFANGWQLVDRVASKVRKAAEEVEERRLEGKLRGQR